MTIGRRHLQSGLRRLRSARRACISLIAGFMLCASHALAPRFSTRRRAALSLAFIALSSAWMGLCWTRFSVVLSHIPLRSPAPTALFEDREAGFLSEGQDVYGALGFWDIGNPIPERIAKACVAIEDRRFHSHLGLDLYGLGRALVRNIGGKREGASTIAMQVIRLGYPRRRTLLAKIDEATGAILLQLIYGREKVLAHYLKVIPMGGPVHGMAYAARRYFRKPAQDLSWAQISLLLALPQDPSGRNLFDFQGFRRARLRARVILGQLRAQGILDAEGEAAALAELNEIAPFVREERPAQAYHYVLRLMDEYRLSPRSRLQKPLRSGLDPEVQALVSRLAEAAIADYRRLGADNLGIMVADVESGDILAYIGSADYFDQTHKGSINYAAINRSSGSTLKPFLFAQGLEEGVFSPATVLADMPLRLKDSGGEYSLSDFDDSYLGPLLYRRALANSRNVPAILVLEGLGLESSYESLAKLGLHGYERPAEFYGYGMAVGGVYTSLEKLMGAYLVLASEGRARPLRWFIDSPVQDKGLLISEDSARQINLFLSDRENRLPSFEDTALMRFPFPVAIKTGTSNGYRDAWTIAYSRKYLVGIWVGHSDNRPMNHLGGSYLGGLALEIFTQLQSQAVQGIAEGLFPPPRSALALRICPHSGSLAGDDCPEPVLEYFLPGTEPHASCDVHRRLVIDSATSLAADLSTPLERRASRVLTILGPQYAAYSQSHGLGLPQADPASLLGASLKLTAPLDGTRVYIDPEIPQRFQTLALRVEAQPAPREVLWLVNGVEYARLPFPYELRWPLSAGEYSFQARFGSALVESRIARVTVLTP